MPSRFVVLTDGPLGSIDATHHVLVELHQPGPPVVVDDEHAWGWRDKEGV